MERPRKKISFTIHPELGQKERNSSKMIKEIKSYGKVKSPQQ
jgi:hypothetical protein